MGGRNEWGERFWVQCALKDIIQEDATCGRYKRREEDIQIFHYHGLKGASFRQWPLGPCNSFMDLSLRLGRETQAFRLVLQIPIYSYQNSVGRVLLLPPKGNSQTVTLTQQGSIQKAATYPSNKHTSYNQVPRSFFS